MKKQTNQKEHMQNTASVSQLSLFKASEPSTVEQIVQKPRAKPAHTWSFRADIPLVREPRSDATGRAIAVRTPEDMASQCADLANSAQEAFVVFDLNTRNNVIDRRLVSLGLLDASLVHPREVFRGAILNAAAAVILAHNHPGGDPNPSAEDLRITRQIIEAGRILGIKVLDHVVIGRPSPDRTKAHCSLREAGLVTFEA
jgi:DNA repair protein RadC